MVGASALPQRNDINCPACCPEGNGFLRLVHVMGGYRANTTRMAVSRATDIARSEGNGPLLAQVGAEADLLELVGLGEDLG